MFRQPCIGRGLNRNSVAWIVPQSRRIARFLVLCGWGLLTWRVKT